MADLRPRPGRGRGPDHGGRDVGQLMLIGALTLAIILVALTLLVNSAIYTQTVATRGSGPAGGSDAIGYLSGVDRAVVDTIQYVNGHETGYSDQTTQIQDSIPRISEDVGRFGAHRGRSASVTYVSRTKGTLVERSTDGPADGYTVSSVEPRAFVLDVDRASFPEDADSSTGPPSGDDLVDLDTQYQITFTSTVTTDEVQVAVLRDNEGSQTVVAVYLNGDRQGYCTDASGTRTRIDIDDAYVGGEYCLPLEFFDDVQQPVDVEFSDELDLIGPSPGEARYEYIVDKDSASFSPPPADVTGTPVIHSVRVDLAYRTPELVYEAERRVVPEAPDE